MENLQDKRILVIDDEPDMLSLVSLLLNRNGAQVITAKDGKDGLKKLNKEHPDLVLLDILMPGLTGFETCSMIVESTKIPVIFLSAMAKDNDIVEGLNSGAVDYITKPFNSKVLVARIIAALRFVDQKFAAMQPSKYDDGYITINLDKRQVTVNGVTMRMTSTELQLLFYFYKHANQMLTYTEILSNVWGIEYSANTNYVHIYVWRLRHKIERNPRKPEYIKSIPGRGYRFETMKKDK